jgi:hypothetical protein
VVRHAGRLVALALLVAAGSARAQVPPAEAPVDLRADEVAACVRDAPAAPTGSVPDADCLAQLPSLLRPALRSAPSTATLAPVLQSLPGSSQPTSWWQRLKRWLSERLGARAPVTLPTWLGEWLERLTPGELLQLILRHALVGGLVIAAALIVVRELRAAGVRLPWPRSARGRRGGAQDTGPDAADATALQALRRAPPAERAGVLFRLVVARFVASGRLPADRSLTHRELRERARLDDAERATWRQLTTLAERQVYAPGVAPPVEAAAVLDEAERRWLAAPAFPVGPARSA